MDLQTKQQYIYINTPKTQKHHQPLTNQPSNQRGSFVFRDAAEDSATAEISRSQIWQWLRHGLTTDDGQPVTLALVHGLVRATAADLWREGRAAGLEAGALKVRPSVGLGLVLGLGLLEGLDDAAWLVGWAGRPAGRLARQAPSGRFFPPRNKPSRAEPNPHPKQYKTHQPHQARIQAATQLYQGLISAPSFPRFITTYLYEQALFQQLVRRAPVR